MENTKRKASTFRKLFIGEFSIKRLIRSFLLIYLIVMVYAFFFAENNIFQPPKPSYQDDSFIIKISTANGHAISALYYPRKNSDYTILYCHGNAEDLGQIKPLLEMFHTHGYSIIGFDYSGYGTSQGAPSEKNAYNDGEAVYDYLTQKLNIPAKKIVVMGRSLGGGIATILASRHKVAGLILESTFVTAFRVVTTYPIMPFDKFNNIGKIDDISCPILIMHGTNDSIIPFWHGKNLFNAANEPKQFFAVKDADHDDLIWKAGKDYWRQIEAFTKSIENQDEGNVSQPLSK